MITISCNLVPMMKQKVSMQLLQSQRTLKWVEGCDNCFDFTPQVIPGIRKRPTICICGGRKRIILNRAYLSQYVDYHPQAILEGTTLKDIILHGEEYIDSALYSGSMLASLDRDSKDRVMNWLQSVTSQPLPQAVLYQAFDLI